MKKVFIGLLTLGCISAHASSTCNVACSYIVEQGNRYSVKQGSDLILQPAGVVNRNGNSAEDLLNSIKNECINSLKAEVKNAPSILRNGLKEENIVYYGFQSLEDSNWVKLDNTSSDISKACH